MQIRFDLTVLLLIVIISQSLFASGMLMFSKRNRLSSGLLAILIFIITLWLCDNFLRIAFIYRQWPNLYFLPIFYSFAFGPLLYFYVKSITNSHFRFKSKDILHFIPVIIQAALYFYLSTKPYDFKNWFWQDIHAPYTYRIEFDGTWISLTIYLILSFNLIRGYQKWIVNNFSEVSKIRLNWLKILLVILLVLCIQWPIEIVLRDFFNLYFEYDYSILMLGVIALVFGIGGLRQANLIAINYSRPEMDKELPNFVADPLVMEKILSAMTAAKLYLNPTLNLVEFSKAIQVNSKVVSKHINAGLEKSFNDFVNEYRVGEVKRRLKTDDIKRMTILAIAYECGFNSKTSFHRIFKDYTGSAPSANL